MYQLAKREQDGKRKGKQPYPFVLRKCALQRSSNLVSCFSSPFKSPTAKYLEDVGEGWEA